MTGATSEDIAAAKARINDGAPLPMGPQSEAMVEMIAGYLVPEGRVIADAADVLSAEDRAVCGRAAAFMEHQMTEWVVYTVSANGGAYEWGPEGTIDDAVVADEGRLKQEATDAWHGAHPTFAADLAAMQRLSGGGG